jgi:hypothetical protein
LLLWFVAVRQAALLLVGIGMGAALAGARFGFTTGWRQLIEHATRKGVIGQVLLLGLASHASMPLLGVFRTAGRAGPAQREPAGRRLRLRPDDADRRRLRLRHLYKAGMGVPLNMGILPLFALGSFLGSAHLDRWLALGQTEPVGLVRQWGAGTALAPPGPVLLAWRWVVRAWVGPGCRLGSRRWVVGRLALAVLAALNLLLAGQPWGVVYGFRPVGGQAGDRPLGLFDPAANAFWSQAGNAQRLSQTLLLDVTTITNIGILGGALWVSAGERQRPAQAAQRTQWVVGLVAGFLMGYSSRLAFGCNVGAMLSGISTGSLHGWIWVPLAFAGTLVGVRVRRHFSSPTTRSPPSWATRWRTRCASTRARRSRSRRRATWRWPWAARCWGPARAPCRWPAWASSWRWTCRSRATWRARPTSTGWSWPRAPATTRAPPSRCGRRWRGRAEAAARSSCPPTPPRATAWRRCRRPCPRWCRCTKRRAKGGRARVYSVQ